MIPRAIPPELVQQLRDETAQLPQGLSPDYSDKQFGAGELASQLVAGRRVLPLSGVPATVISHGVLYIRCFFPNGERFASAAQ